MNKRPKLIFALASLIVVVGMLFWQQKIRFKNESVTINEITVPPVPALDTKEIAQGKEIYNQYCASCHGVNLESVPNWKIFQPKLKNF